MFQGSQVGTERDIHGMSARRNESDTITANEFGLIRSKFVDPLRIQIPQYLHDFTAQGVATDLIAGKTALSTSRCRMPCRASARAVPEPAGPAPSITTGKCSDDECPTGQS